jgi:MoxR-like ATPase
LSAPENLLADWHARALELERLAASVVIGQPRVVRQLVVAVFARGHVLLQGDVGVGKTTLLRAFARLIGGEFARIEGTIDLMPADLIYYTYIDGNGRPAVDFGPLTKHAEALSIFFFNEINRARPQVHALLLRVMAERTVSAFNRELKLPHLLVFADRNRVEREETFEISSAARDRFMMEVFMEAPIGDADRRALAFDTRFHDAERLIESLPGAVLAHRELDGIARTIQQHIQAQPALQDYALRLWRATQSPAAAGVRVSDVDTGALMLAGASPRGVAMLLRAARVNAWLNGRGAVTPEDVQAVFHETVGHRLCLQPVYELRREQIVPALLAGMLDAVPAP